MKRKEIKFQNVHGALRGRQNGMEFWIYKDQDLDTNHEPANFVVIHQKSNQGRRRRCAGLTRI